MLEKEYEVIDELVLVMDALDIDAEDEQEAFMFNTELWLDQALGLTRRGEV